MSQAGGEDGNDDDDDDAIICDDIGAEGSWVGYWEGTLGLFVGDVVMLILGFSELRAVGTTDGSEDGVTETCVLHTLHDLGHP